MAVVARKKSQTVRLLEALVKGKTFSLRNIEDKFGARDPKRVLNRVKELGVNIEKYVNPRTKEVRYRIPKAS